MFLVFNPSICVCFKKLKIKIHQRLERDGSVPIAGCMMLTVLNVRVA